MVSYRYDFSALADGDPFPQGFSFGVLSSEGGQDQILDETAPSLYYYVEDGKGVYNYTEQVVGPQTNRRGFVSSPATLFGDKLCASVSFANPFKNLDVTDEVWLQVGLGLRAKEKTNVWVGGLLESRWTPGIGWNPKWKLSAIKNTGTVKHTIQALIKDVEHLNVNELKVSKSSNDYTITYNGVEVVGAESDFRGESLVALWIRATKFNISDTPIPILLATEGEVLDSAFDRPIQEVPSFYLDPPVDGAHSYNIPVRELEQDKTLVRIGENAWRFTRDITITRPDDNIHFAGSKDSVIVAHRQNLVDARMQVCKFQYR